MITIIYDALYILILSFVIWYPWSWFEYFLNSGNLGRDNYLFVFYCFFEDCKIYNPRNKQAKKDFVKRLFPMNRVQDCVVTYKKTWMLKDLLSANSQEYDDDKLLECFKSIMGTGLYFYGKHIFILFISALIVIGIRIEL